MPVVAALPKKFSPVSATAPATLTVAELLVEPPAPLHVNVNVLFTAYNTAVFAEPEVGCTPDHEPLAMQELAFVDDHVRDEIPPLATRVGLAVSSTCGNALTVTVTDALALPPVPEQLSV